METVNIAPTWMGLARICIDDLRHSDLSTRKLAITLLEDACTTLDKLNEEAEAEQDNDPDSAQVLTLQIAYKL